MTYTNDTTSAYPPGTVVQWTNKFLRSIGLGPRDPSYRQRAVVVDRPDMLGRVGGPFCPTKYLVVLWDGAEAPTVVNLANVAKRTTPKLLDNPVLPPGVL